MEDTRVCKEPNCESKGSPQPIADFPLNGDGKGGRRWQCKRCMRSRNKNWRANNKERVAQYNKERRPKEKPAQE